MQKQVGLWIDHRKAVIVTIENDRLQYPGNRIKYGETYPIFKRYAIKRSSINRKDQLEEDSRDRQFGNHLDNIL